MEDKIDCNKAVTDLSQEKLLEVKLDENENMEDKIDCNKAVTDLSQEKLLEVKLDENENITVDKTFKLSELKNIANSLSININYKKGHKEVNKTKTMLIEDINAH
jgi:hypothetical protein